MKVAQLGEGHIDALLCVIRRMVEKSAVEEMQEYVCTAGEIGRCIKEPLIHRLLKAAFTPDHVRAAPCDVLPRVALRRVA